MPFLAFVYIVAVFISFLELFFSLFFFQREKGWVAVVYSLMATAGLSRAYAVLRQLDVLRTDDILNPVPQSSSSHERRKTTGSDRAEVGKSAVEKEPPPRRIWTDVDGSVLSPPAHRAGSSANQCGSGAFTTPYSTSRDAVVDEPPFRTTVREAYLAPPSFRDAVSDTLVGDTTAETSFASPASRSGVETKANAYAPNIHTTASPSSSSSVANERPTSPAAARPLSSTRSAYTGHIYMRHSPRTSPHRTCVPSPVVLPALSTSEADHILAHASTSLERFFDRDDMPSVLASVAAAAAATTQGTEIARRPHSAAGTTDLQEQSERWGTHADVTTPLRSATTFSSLTHSPSSRPANTCVDCVRGARNTQHMRSMHGSSRWTGEEEKEDGFTDGLKPITITPSVERLLEAVRTSSQYNERDRKDNAEIDLPLTPNRDANGGVDNSTGKLSEEADTLVRSPRSLDTAPSHSSGFDGQFSPIEPQNSPQSRAHERDRLSPTLSSFYTARRRGSRCREDERRNAAAQTFAEPATLPSPPPPMNMATASAELHNSCNHSSEEQRRSEAPSEAPTDPGEGCRPTTPPLAAGQGDGERSENDDDESTRDFNNDKSEMDVATRSTEEQTKEAVEVTQLEPRDNASEVGPQLTEDTDNSAPSPDFPAQYTDALPFLDYVARVNAAASSVLLKELAAMGDAWAASMRNRREGSAGVPKAKGSDKPAVQRDEDEAVDCLALSLLLNKPAALQHIAVPLLRAQLKNALRVLHDLEAGEGGGARADRAFYTRRNSDLEEAEKVRQDGRTTSPASTARAANFNNVLCAVIGLGSAAFSLLPLLLQLLLQLPPPTPRSVCDVRLVGLAIRTSGAAEGLRALTRIVEERREATHVLTAAAFAISTYAHELAGHTSAVCVPAGTLQRGREDGLYRLMPDPQIPAPSHWSSVASLASVERELQPLWSRSAALSATAPPHTSGAAPAGTHLVYLQSPPPYRPTHIVMDAEAARQSLRKYIASDVFCVRRDHPYVMVLLDDALNSSLLCPVLAEASSERTFKPVWDRMRRDLHHVLCGSGVGDNSDTKSEHKPGNSTARGLQLPLLLYSIQDFFTDEKDMLFAVESALVHALVSRSAPLFQEQALLSLCALPPEARVHVVQPLTDFFLKAAWRYQVRRATTMRRGCTSTGDCGNVEGASSSAEEAVVVAAAIAAGTACVNPLTPESCTSRCAAALVPVFTELLQTSQWRVRHAACIGLARVGPYTSDPSSVVDLFLSLLSPAAAPTASSSSLLGSTTAVPGDGSQPALQPSTVVWCLAQQQQGGVRALLRLMQDTQVPSSVHDWCAFQLADVDVFEACQEVDKASTPDADALLDEMVQVLGKLIAVQGALEEDTVLLCVRALAEVVHRGASVVQSLPDPVARAAPISISSSPVPCVLPLQTPQLEQEAATYYASEPLNSCFTALTSVMEAALLPTNVLKALCFYLCKYGGAHGELYVCEMLLESDSVAARSAAAFGLRACGAKVVRSVVLGMNDANFDVRREALDTMDAIGAANVLAVLRHRPVEHRRQVLAALRDCLLQDAGRSVARKAADTVYRALAREE